MYQFFVKFDNVITIEDDEMILFLRNKFDLSRLLAWQGWNPEAVCDSAPIDF